MIRICFSNDVDMKLTQCAERDGCKGPEESNYAVQKPRVQPSHHDTEKKKANRDLYKALSHCNADHVNLTYFQKLAIMVHVHSNNRYMLT